VQLVGFILRIDHDARSSECQIQVWSSFRNVFGYFPWGSPVWNRKYAIKNVFIGVSFRTLVYSYHTTRNHAAYNNNIHCRKIFIFIQINMTGNTRINVRLWRVRATFVAMEKQLVLHSLSAYL